jgi:PAS domain S-box-containing protein
MPARTDDNPRPHALIDFLSSAFWLKTEQIALPEHLVHGWQELVDIAAQICRVPAAVIMRVEDTSAHVACASGDPDNPYRSGDRHPLKGSYAETVMQRRSPLLIPSAVRDSHWHAHPDRNFGMTAFLGFPIRWSTGSLFGVFGLMDTRPNEALQQHQNYVLKLKELIEAQLANLYFTLAVQGSFENILNNLKEGVIAHDLKRRIMYINDQAEKVTGYSRNEVIGKDCHVAFGEPFCGQQCSFCSDAPPLSTGSAEYCVNITSKQGQSRKVEMRATMMKDQDGKDFGVLATFKDITELADLRFKVGESFTFANIVGRDKTMRAVFQQIRNLVDYDFPVHIYGETGTGKELIACAIHNESHRQGGAFVPINCGALPESLIESELFGHVRGAFTGAIREKKGRFELADGGTIFLDEVAELSKLMQVKLLRFLQEGTFEKVGGEKTLSVDVRVISATNKDLKTEVKNGRFREDLYYRLNVIPINIPPIRERKSDIPLLVEHFLKQMPATATKISNDAMQIMMRYKWPGNVRELQNAIQFAIVHAKGNTIRPEDLPLELKTLAMQQPRRGPARKLTDDTVKAALAQTAGNKAKAAKRLGVGRATLYRFLNDHPELF